MELLMPSRLRGATPGKERGVVLFVTLVVLILMTLATLSVVRSMDTGNVIAGNFAFKEAVTQVSDRAITDAMNNLANIATTPAASTGNTDIANRYFALRQTTLDAQGIPSAINWNNVSCSDEIGAAVTNCNTDTGKYRVQYYIERQCDSAPVLTDPTDIKTKCDYEVRIPASVAPPAAEQIAIRYRIIIRARGPRDATGLYEVMVSGPV